MNSNKELIEINYQMDMTLKQEIEHIYHQVIHKYNLQDDDKICNRLRSKFDYIESKVDMQRNYKKMLHRYFENNILQYYQSIKFNRGKVALTRKCRLDKLLTYA